MRCVSVSYALSVMIFILPRINLLDSVIIRSCILAADIVISDCAFFRAIHTYRVAVINDVLCSFWHVFITVIAYSISHGDHLLMLDLLSSRNLLLPSFFLNALCHLL